MARFIAGQNGAPLQNVLQFADIARPVVGGEFGHAPRIHPLDRRLAAHPLHEMVHQQRQILACSASAGVRMRKTASR